MKEASTGLPSKLTEEALSAINAFTKKELSEADVFSFDLLLCDNEVDRDFECFSVQALETLQQLFLGKTGIFDHNWSATGQKARIYKTEVVTDPMRKTTAGDDYVYLKASAYILRTPQNEELIAEIEGGIKKEVSIGCSVSGNLCSICGEDVLHTSCSHTKGCMYQGKLCYVQLTEPTDAYEWSFVAVPAQKNAGVLKQFGGCMDTQSITDLKAYIQQTQNKALSVQLDALERLAEMGKQHLKNLRQEVVRLGVMADCGFSEELLQHAVAHMEEPELLGFQKAFSDRADALYPPVCQLHPLPSEQEKFSGDAFLI